VSISSMLNTRFLRTNVLSYIHQRQNVTRKAAKKRLWYEKFAHLTLMKLTAGECSFIALIEVPEVNLRSKRWILLMNKRRALKETEQWNHTAPYIILSTNTHTYYFNERVLSISLILCFIYILYTLHAWLTHKNSYKLDSGDLNFD